MDNMSKFSEKTLSPIEKFYSKLTDKSITEDDYEFASSIWKKYNCTTIREYHDLYLITDVLLLAENF